MAGINLRGRNEFACSVFDARQVALALGGEVVGRDSVLAAGPGHSREDRSLSVKIDPGAPDSLLIHSFADDDWRRCRDHVFAALEMSVRRPSLSVARRARTDKSRPTSEQALRLWHEAGDARGTLAQRYLGSRKLALPPRSEDVLRFHPSCPFGEKRLPCLVALYRDIATNEPKAIHRTALSSDARKIDRKVLGPKSGCSIKLSADEDVTSGLTIAEGIETALAGMALSFCPAWALGDAHELANFPPLSGIECLTVLVDNDESGRGQASAVECSGRWTGAGREVFRVLPDRCGDDINDIVQRTVA
jgi:Toprim domain